MLKNVIECYVEKVKKYRRQYQELSEKIEKYQKKIEILKEKINALESISWVTEIVTPLAEELSKQIGKRFAIYGPFGLRAATTIYLFEDEYKDITQQETWHITLVPGDLDKGEIFYETGEVRNAFPPGTIGYMNGMNNITKPIPNNVEEIIKLLQYSNSSYRNIFKN